MEVASHGGEAKTAVQRGFECEQACIASLPLAPYPPPMDRGQGQGTMQYSSLLGPTNKILVSPTAHSKHFSCGV
jgi:hypothetical protein